MSQFRGTGVSLFKPASSQYNLVWCYTVLMS